MRQQSEDGGCNYSTTVTVNTASRIKCNGIVVQRLGYHDKHGSESVLRKMEAAKTTRTVFIIYGVDCFD